MMDGAMINNKGEKVSTNVAVDYLLKEGIPFNYVFFFVSCIYRR